MDNHILQPTDIAWIKPNFDVLKMITKDDAIKQGVLLWERSWKQGEKLKLLTTNNHSDLLQETIKQLQTKNYSIDVYYTDDVWFKLALGWYDQMLDYQKQLALKKDYRLEATWEKAIELMKETLAHKASYNEVDLITELVRLSFQSWASDMHMQSESQGVVVRLRRNGILETIDTLSHEEFVVYLMKIKYIAWVKINIAKTPQDGRFDFEVWTGWVGHRIDARVSFMPWLRGESVVIRFLDSSKSIMTFTDIWFAPYHIPIITNNLAKNSWLILVTWPTGSGKTTTLYSMLAYLNTSDIKIVTLEDPVEYEIPGIQQSWIHENDGYTFAEWVRAVLRHDPDVILVWEIRDLDTANAAINAALTGHLVFSTLHTNSALDTISRLLNLWVKPYLLAPAINMIIWQRLVRKLGDDKVIRTDQSIPIELEEWLKYVSTQFPEYLWEKPTLYDPKSEGEWYSSRVAIAEIFEPTSDERNQITQGKLGLEMIEGIRKRWYLTMQEDGFCKVYKWVTTLEELRRIA